MEGVTNGAETPGEWVERLWDRYSLQVLRFFVRRGFTIDESRDLRQDVYLRAFTHHRADLENEKAFFFTIVRTIWKNHLRYIQTVGRSAEELPIDTTSLPESMSPLAELVGARDPRTPFEEARWKQLLEDVVRAVDGFPPRMRHTAILKLRGFANKDVAILMSVTQQTVKTQVFHLRQRLREALRVKYPDLFGENGDEDDAPGGDG